MTALLWRQLGEGAFASPRKNWAFSASRTAYIRGKDKEGSIQITFSVATFTAGGPIYTAEQANFRKFGHNWAHVWEKTSYAMKDLGVLMDLMDLLFPEGQCPSL